MNPLNVIWFFLIGVLIIGYAILDGFDLGVGIITLFTRNQNLRSVYLRAISPFWDGNEVWLLTAGGALFAAFPKAYATVFSAFYLAFILLLFALILRAVSIEFRWKVDSDKWRNFWDFCFGIGSLIAAFLFGVAFGNIIRGIPIDANGVFTGNFIGFLNPHAILIGALTLAFFIMHGAFYLLIKTDGEVPTELILESMAAWFMFIVLTGASITSIQNYYPEFFKSSSPFSVYFWLFKIVFPISQFSIILLFHLKKYNLLFISSCVSIACMTSYAGLTLFPKIVPSSINPDFSLTLMNASSSPLTLQTMLIIAIIGIPLVLIYTIYAYRIFRGKVAETEETY